MPIFESITNLKDGAEALRNRRYGVIEVAEGRFSRVLLRPWPKVVWGPGVLWVGQWRHRQRPGNRIRLYYNQPLRFPQFLALKYAISSRETSMASLSRALDVLDEIARLKHSDALLCDAGNWRISARLMARWGWEPHCPSRWHRHFIKRFYGAYPPPASWLAMSQVIC
jgi:hypothetical protein